MKKKIIFVINTLGGAGAENALAELLQAVNFKKYNIYLYVILNQGELISKIPKGVTLLNENYKSLSVWSAEGKRNMALNVCKAAFTHLSGIRRLPYVLSNLCDMIKERHIQADKLFWRILADSAERFDTEYDLAVSFIEGASAYYVADYVRAKKKAAFIHTDYGLAGYTRKLDKYCFSCFDRIFTVSYEVKEAFLKVYPECENKTFVFHNILNFDKIKEMAKEKCGFNDDFKGKRILTVGRLTEPKAYDIAIDAMKLLKNAGYNIRWYVLGEGEKRKKLEKKIEALGLKDDFILAGAVSNPFPYYAQTDLYVHATRYEGKSIAIQEAQVLGCAILASDCNGNREQIEKGVDGWLCNLSPEGISEGIAYMLEHPREAEKFGKAAARKKLFDEGEIKQLLDLLED